MKYKYIIILLSGWGISRFIFSLFRDIELFGLIIEPGIVAVSLLPFLILFEASGHTWFHQVNVFVSGIVADSLLYWLMRQGNEITALNTGPWDGTIWVGSGIALLYAVIMYLIGSLSEHTLTTRLSGKGLWWLPVATVLTVIVFRFSYILTAHLPNEQRSTILFGVELHHIAFGAVILVGFCGVGNWQRVFQTPWLSIVAGIAVGMILDQSIYLSLPHVTDTAYNSIASWVSAMLLTSMFVLTTIWLGKIRNG